MDVLEALYTTRAMRRVEPTPVPERVQALILDAAVRAPSGGNQQNWRFLLVDDPDILGQLGPIYRSCIDMLWQSVYKDRLEKARANPDDPESAGFLKIYKSVEYAAEHFGEYPLLLFGFVQHDPTGGSIFPAVWNAMLAARSEGVGSSLTSVLMFRLGEVLELLKVPTDEGWIMACCVTFGYPKGKWAVAPRQPVQDVAYKNQWAAPLGFDVDGPLWTPEAKD
jgi:nitroreductase